MAAGLQIRNAQNEIVLDSATSVVRVVGYVSFNGATAASGSYFCAGLQDGRPIFLLQPEETAAPQPEIWFGYNGPQGNGWVYWSYNGVAQNNAYLVLMVY